MSGPVVTLLASDARTRVMLRLGADVFVDDREMAVRGLLLQSLVDVAAIVDGLDAHD